MADIISPILSVISLICSCSGRNICYLCDLKENQDALKTAIEELKNTRDDLKRQIDDAETNPNERKKRTLEVNGWLERVQTIEGEVVEILQKVDKQIAGRCLGGYCSKSCWSGYKIGKSVVQKLACVKELKSKGHFDSLTYNLPPPSVQEMNVDPTVGMESMFEKVWRFISTDGVRSMCLYGQGGVGKTRLLKQINNEFLKTMHNFDVVILVVVSRVVNVEAIQRKIGDRLGLLLQKNNNDESKTAEKIFNVLRTKNFVLLLDDIWEKLDLQRIGVPRLDDKSKIIFTTRSETICGLMEANKKFKVECLPWDKAWSLFQEKVGKEVLNSFRGAVELAKDVAKQCGGLPLALITIGLAMSNKCSREEWDSVITTLKTSASKFQGMGDTVLPLLKLSYDNLHNETLKSCFLYCSLFPEDYSIDKAQLIDFWFVEGILNEYDNILKARNHGYAVIGSLKAACLLESGVDEETDVKMHDSIRDLALWIANDFGNKVDKCFVSLNMSETWKKSERIFLMVDEAGKEMIKVPESPNLLTLLVHGDPLFLRSLKSAEYFFQFTPFLRVLDLSNSKLEIIHKSITDLLELQYLGLSRTSIRALPRELSKLVKLKYLDLSHTYALIDIPRGLIASLSELQVLNLHFCSFGDWEVNLYYGVSLQELVRLENLYDLRITINNFKALEKLCYDSNLNKHVRSLTLMKCEHLQSVAVARYTSFIMSPNLGFFMNLKDLKFFRCVDLEVLTLEEHDLSPILETLSLLDLPKLNKITARDLTPQEVPMSFRNLNSIVISDCDELKELTWLVYCLNLKKLVLQCCKGMEEIIGDGSEIEQSLMANKVFYCLKTVELYSLPKLKSICRHTLAFPSLESMEVGYCPELKKLPFSDLPCKFNNTVQGIKGGTKWWNELQWEDENLKSKILPYFQEKPWECDDNESINTRSVSGGGVNVAVLQI